jgi:hypothetical protein
MNLTSVPTHHFVVQTMSMTIDTGHSSAKVNIIVMGPTSAADVCGGEIRMAMVAVLVSGFPRHIEEHFSVRSKAI